MRLPALCGTRRVASIDVAAALSREHPAPRVVLTSTDTDEAVGSLLRRSGALRFVAKEALASAQIGALWEPAA